MVFAAGDQITVTISDIAFGGEGVARVEDFVFFIPFVAPGEVVKAQVVEVKKRFGRARLLEILQSSRHRLPPLCPYFGECGGCQYQHLEYETQLEIKHKQVRDQFQRIGGLDPAIVEPVIPCPAPYGYRNRVMVRTQWDKIKQGLNLGFIRCDSRLVVDVQACKIAEPVLNEQLQRLRLNPPPKGGLKRVLRKFPVNWEVPPDSFFQNNFFLLPRFSEVVRERLKAAVTRHLIDVYCGVGFFGIETADLVESFVGVEYDQQAIRAAKTNAIHRGVKNGRFLAGTAEELLPGLIKAFSPAATTVLLDPPRKGCQVDTLELLRQIRPAQVIYVSCHPATMARDLNFLCSESAFEVARIIPLDMFPQTTHVECVADLRGIPPRVSSDKVDL